MIAHVWWSAHGAEGGHPWRVQFATGETVLAKTVRFEGSARTLTNPEGFPMPDGPRGIIEIDGEVFLNE